MTNGGVGVAFFAPFLSTRYFFPYRPIEVSPLDVGTFFTPRGVAVLQSEVLCIWLPAAGFVLLARLCRLPSRPALPAGTQ